MQWHQWPPSAYFQACILNWDTATVISKPLQVIDLYQLLNTVKTICNPLLHLLNTANAEDEGLPLQLWGLTSAPHHTFLRGSFPQGITLKGHLWVSQEDPEHVAAKTGLKQHPKSVASVPWPGIGRGKRADGCTSDDWAAGRVDETQFNSLHSATGPRKATCQRFTEANFGRVGKTYKTSKVPQMFSSSTKMRDIIDNLIIN